MFDLRYYQHDARDAIIKAWDRYQSTLCVMPTGTGKTELFLSIAVEEPKRVMVLVHRDYLITSPIDRLARHGFDSVGVEKAERSADSGFDKPKIVFASVQSMSEQRMRKFNPFEFSTLIIDEGHRAIAKSYRAVIDYFKTNPKLKILIVTATPKRKDGIALGNVCDSEAFAYSPAEAAAEGWIVRPRFFQRDVPQLDFSNVRMKGQDFDPDQLEQLMTQEEALHKICASLADDRGPTIVFCASVAIARVYATVFEQRYRPGRAVALWADSDDETREAATKGLADGKLDYIFNVDLFTEGYDVPHLVRVVWTNPTGSLMRWTQGCGRSFRPHHSIARMLSGGREESAQRRLMIEQSPKPFCEIVTYVPSNCRHTICTPLDLLGGRELPDEVKTKAEQIQQETARQGDGSDTESDIESAKCVIDLRKAIDYRRREIKAKAIVHDAEYDGMGGGQRYRKADSIPTGDVLKTALGVAASWGNGEPATPKQLGWFKYKGVCNPESLGMTKWRAVVVRNLYEAGVSLSTALTYSKKQALAVEASMKSRAMQHEEIPA